MKTISLTQGKVALVDDDDFEKLNAHKWCYGRGRAVRGVTTEDKGTRTITMHRELVATSPRLQVIHVDGNTLNNQRSNLRVVSYGEARRQRSTANKTGYKGVHPMYNRFMAKISRNGKIEYLGTFATAIDAARAYDRKLLEYVGEHAKLNLSDDAWCKHLEVNGVLHEFTDTECKGQPSDKQQAHPGDGPPRDGQNNLRGERQQQCG